MTSLYICENLFYAIEFQLRRKAYYGRASSQHSGTHSIIELVTLYVVNVEVWCSVRSRAAAGPTRWAH